MLTIDRPAPNRIDVTLTGRLDAEAMRVGLDDLLAKAEGVRHGRMLYRIPDFVMPTLGAVSVELGRLPALFRLIGRFERCAVLSDAAWIRDAGEIKGALFPGLDIRGFASDEVAQAEAWLARDA